jgi:hypothetical protein
MLIHYIYLKIDTSIIDKKLNSNYTDHSYLQNCDSSPVGGCFFSGFFFYLNFPSQCISYQLNLYLMITCLM